jgi:hypothetical protein
MEKVPEQRASGNKPVGTLVTKSISVTKEVHKEFVMEKVLLAFEEKWRQAKIVIIRSFIIISYNTLTGGEGSARPFLPRCSFVLCRNCAMAVAVMMDAMALATLGSSKI